MATQQGFRCPGQTVRVCCKASGIAISKRESAKRLRPDEEAIGETAPSSCFRHSVHFGNQSDWIKVHERPSRRQLPALSSPASASPCHRTRQAPFSIPSRLSVRSAMSTRVKARTSSISPRISRPCAPAVFPAASHSRTFFWPTSQTIVLSDCRINFPSIVPFTQSGQWHLFSDMDSYLHFVAWRR
jgi:hypothetical protein